MNPALIARALTTFKTDTATAPGRFNVMEVNGVEVILDYGHNTAAVHALAEAVLALEPRRTHVIMTLPGDRKNTDLITTLQASLPIADAYYLHDSQDRRGRAKNEVPLLLQAQIPTDIPSQIVNDEKEAVNEAWGQVQPGDRVVIIADLVDETIDLLRNLVRSVSDDSGCRFPVIEEEA